MSIQAPTSDAGLLDLLRITGPLGVTELADAMEVTPTAVRQRLVRLMAQNSIDREAPATAADARDTAIGSPKRAYA
jgi:predicted ArsR family transcriptional regulator